MNSALALFTRAWMFVTCPYRLMSDWKVELVEDNISEFYVDFGGPKDSECSTLAAVLLCSLPASQVSVTCDLR